MHSVFAVLKSNDIRNRTGSRARLGLHRRRRVFIFHKWS
jgi:hypothetical protein